MKHIILALALTLTSFFSFAHDHGEKATMTKTLKVEKMTCGDCADKVKKAFSSIEDVEVVSVDHKTGMVKVKIPKDSELSDGNFAHALKDTKYTLAPKSDNEPKK